MQDEDENPEAAGGVQHSTGRRNELCLQTIQSAQPQLYVNIIGEPMIELPLTGAAEVRRPFRLRSTRARAALHAFICDEAKFVPYEQEVNRILWVLEDIAWRDVRSDVTFEAAIELHALIEAVSILLQKPEWLHGYHGTASRLRQLLIDTAVENDIDVRQKQWPKCAARLSQQLWELQATLARGGIVVERGRTGAVRWIALRPSGPRADGPPAASPERPITNSADCQDLTTPGDGDGVLRALMESIDANLEEKE